jgi:hypothetical protein
MGDQVLTVDFLLVELVKTSTKCSSGGNWKLTMENKPKAEVWRTWSQRWSHDKVKRAWEVTQPSVMLFVQAPVWKNTERSAKEGLSPRFRVVVTWGSGLKEAPMQN